MNEGAAKPADRCLGREHSQASADELSSGGPELSVVVPMFNEQDNVEPFVETVRQALSTGGASYELLLVDDGSTDGTWSAICQVAERDRTVRGISLSRNFGHQSALFAGLHHAMGSAIVTMDGDLQHPPSLLPAMLQAWRAGFQVVNTQRADSTDTSWWKRATSRWFYAVFSRLSGVAMTPGSSDFRLLDRDAARAVKEMGDTDLFIRGIVNWLGFKTTVLPYQAAQRHSGLTKFTLTKMLRFSTGALLSFSAAPLKLGIWLGFLTSVLAFAEICYILVRFLQGITVPGWASVMTFLSLMFGILFILIGIVGIYVGKIFDIVKSRPRFVVGARVGFGE